MTCSTCRYFDPHTKDRGSCRRYPPQWTIEWSGFGGDSIHERPVGSVSMFPSVDAEDYCGCHEPKPEIKP
jgi:hypothetical protein